MSDDEENLHRARERYKRYRETGEALTGLEWRVRIWAKRMQGLEPLDHVVWAYIQSHSDAGKLATASGVADALMLPAKTTQASLERLVAAHVVHAGVDADPALCPVGPRHLIASGQGERGLQTPLDGSPVQHLYLRRAGELLARVHTRREPTGELCLVEAVATRHLGRWARFKRSAASGFGLLRRDMRGARKLADELGDLAFDEKLRVVSAVETVDAPLANGLRRIWGLDGLGG